MTKEQIDELKNMPYSDYLKTEYWKIVSEQARANAKNKCQVCGRSNKNLHVHHNTYEHRGEELEHMEDLVCLCEDCHFFYHHVYNTIFFVEREDKVSINRMNKVVRKLDKEFGDEKGKGFLESYAKLDKCCEKFRNENVKLKEENDKLKTQILNYSTYFINRIFSNERII